MYKNSDKRYASSNYNIRPQAIAIDTIVLHYTELNFSDSLFTLTNSNQQTGVSSHYLVDKDGTVYQLVEEEYRAWHAGVSHWLEKPNVNDNSIGIEIVNYGNEYYTEEQESVLRDLCTDIMQRHNIKPGYVIGHSDIAYWRKKDPGIFFPWKELSVNGVGVFVENIDIAKTPWFTLWHKDPFYAECATTLLRAMGYEVTGLYPSDVCGDNDAFNAMRAFELHYCNEFLREELHANVSKVLAEIILMRSDIDQMLYNQEINFLMQDW